MDRRQLLGWGVATCTLPSWAQNAWPAKPITLVVPSSAGGGTDAFARALGQVLAGTLRQPVIVENKPGASGNLGAEYVARAPADGYTLLVTASAAVAINPALYPKTTFDVTRDLMPIARGVSSPYLLLAQPSLGVATLADLIARAKQAPGKLAFGSAGTGTVPYLGVRMLEEAAGVRFLHIPYKGLAPAFQDVIGGQISFILADVASAGAHRDRLKPLACSEAVRGFDKVPTFQQAGYPGVKPANYFSLLAPAGTPADIANRLGASVNAAMRTPALAARLDSMGLVPVFDTPEKFSATLAEERSTWAAFIRRNGIKPGD
ncbi:MAG TPA: tripartite tricarboxylate transporter substrate-binding protein [Ramlibacter sp.]|nr:tripartite tricarboxylate transporter substrate-binding protein [Ramlibacter sp.]